MLKITIQEVAAPENKVEFLLSVPFEGSIAVYALPPLAEAAIVRDFLNALVGAAAHVGINVVGELQPLIPITLPPPPPPPPSKGIFVEQFNFLGDHAATGGGGTFTTVWWGENWDAQVDTGNNSWEGAGLHVDVHPANPSIYDGTRANDRAVVDGDGGPGVGVMHLDFEGTIGVRLRNPIVITPDGATVEFMAPALVTSGHWWELVIMPTEQVRSAQYSMIPSTSDLIDGQGGPGKRPAQNSVNILLLGANDQTNTQDDLHITARINGMSHQRLGPTFSTGGPVGEADGNKLYPWRVTFYPHEIQVDADLNGDGLENIFTTSLDIPWPEAYVHLVAVAYQANHHPQPRWHLGQVREIAWREFRAFPMRYHRTTIYPKDGGIAKTPQATGWTVQDPRDTQRSGNVHGVPQPNPEQYDKHSFSGYCSIDAWGCSRVQSDIHLELDISTEDAMPARAQFLYKTRSPSRFGTGTGALAVNGVHVSDLANDGSLAGAGVEESGMLWTSLSVDIPPELLQADTNTFDVHIQGGMAINAMQLELSFL